jgi:hypothetical protein
LICIPEQNNLGGGLLKVRYISNKLVSESDTGYYELILNNIYEVYSIDERCSKGECNYVSYYIICSEGEPYCYNPKRFEIVDGKIDENWEKEVDEDKEGTYIAYTPKEFNDGIFDDYSELDISAIFTFHRYVISKFEKDVGILEANMIHPLKSKKIKRSFYQIFNFWSCYEWM